MILRYGNYRNRDIRNPEVPDDYLQYLLNQKSTEVHELKAELLRREVVRSAGSELIEKLVQAGVEALRPKTPPDELEAAKQKILEAIATEWREIHPDEYNSFGNGPRW